MDPYDEEWRRKGATLSDKTARSQFGLTQDELIAAIRVPGGSQLAGRRMVNDVTLGS